MFFGGNKNIDKLQFGKISPKTDTDKHERTYYWLKLDKSTLLVIIPFFSGRYGLNSDYLLQEMGGRIKGILEQNA